MRQSATVAALSVIWGICREQGHQVGHDLRIDHATLDTLDEIADTPGIGAGMASVGWAIANPDGSVTLPKFFSQNASTEKLDAKRAADRDRQRAKREAVRQAATSPGVARDVACESRATPGDVASQRRGEERRENAQPPLPPPELSPAPKKAAAVLPPELDTDAFRAAWQRWEAHRREIRHTLTPTTVDAQVKALAKMGVARAIETIDHTILKGWQGLREPDSPRSQAGSGGAPGKPPRKPLAEQVAEAMEAVRARGANHAMG